MHKIHQQNGIIFLRIQGQRNNSSPTVSARSNELELYLDEIPAVLHTITLTNYMSNGIKNGTVELLTITLYPRLMVRCDDSL